MQALPSRNPGSKLLHLFRHSFPHQFVVAPVEVGEGRQHLALQGIVPQLGLVQLPRDFPPNLAPQRRPPRAKLQLQSTPLRSVAGHELFVVSVNCPLHRVILRRLQKKVVRAGAQSHVDSQVGHDEGQLRKNPSTRSTPEESAGSCKNAYGGQKVPHTATHKAGATFVVGLLGTPALSTSESNYSRRLAKEASRQTYPSSKIIDKGSGL